jgi:hypothetical protein
MFIFWIGDSRDMSEMVGNKAVIDGDTLQIHDKTTTPFKQTYLMSNGMQLNRHIVEKNIISKQSTDRKE